MTPIPPSSYQSGKVPNPSRRGVVAVVVRETRFLVIRRSIHVRAPRAICFPGGGLETGETEQEALVREMKEELAVHVTPQRRLWENATPSGVRLGWWLSQLDDDQMLVPNPAEVESIHWFDAQELRSFPELLVTNHDFLSAWERQQFTLDP
ncbi:MAG: NUDIX domain-containing protein [Planctomycetales bacterium]|nr:NUDIX domain-containing protein [Planctomycetales bacterium]